MGTKSFSTLRWLVCAAVVGGCAASATGTGTGDGDPVLPYETDDYLISRDVVDQGIIDYAPARFRFDHPDYRLNGTWHSTAAGEGYFDVVGERRVPTEWPIDRFGSLEVRETWSKTVGGNWIVTTIEGFRTEATEEHADEGVIRRDVLHIAIRDGAEEPSMEIHWFDHVDRERRGNQVIEDGRTEDWRTLFRDGQPDFRSGHQTTFHRVLTESGVATVSEESHERRFWDGPPGDGDWSTFETSEVYSVDEGDGVGLRTTAIETKVRNWRRDAEGFTIVENELRTTNFVTVRQPADGRIMDEVRSETLVSGAREGTTGYLQRRDYADMDLTLIRDEIRIESDGDVNLAGRFTRETRYDPSTKAYTFHGFVRDTDAEVELSLRWSGTQELDAVGLGGEPLSAFQGVDVDGVAEYYGLLHERERFYTLVARPFWERHEDAYPFLFDLTGSR